VFAHSTRASSFSLPISHHTDFWIDGVVILLYFALIVGIGLRAGRGNATLKEFALGGRAIPWWAVLASIIAAETSAATFLGTPAEGFKTHAFFYGQLAIGTVIARVVIAFTFIGPYYKYGVESIYEFLMVRFGPWTKNAASGIFLFTRVLGIGVRLYLGGVILVELQRYLGATPTLESYFWGILAVTLVTTAYTMVGGIKAVIWTDLIQATLMLGSVGFLICFLLHQLGGLHAATQAAGGWEHLQWIQVGWDHSLPFGKAFAGMLAEPYTIFAAVIGSTFFTMATHGTDQDMVQRLLTAPNPAKSRLSLILSGLADIPIALAFLSVGILLYLFYHQPTNGVPNVPDNNILAHFIVFNLPVGLRGLIIAGVLATMMGSTSAALNALATSFTTDFYLPYLNPSADERASVHVARLSTLIFGLLMVVVGTLAAYSVLHDPRLTIIPLAIGILGYTYGSLLGVFLLGMLSSRLGSDKMNVVAMIGGIFAVFFVGKVHLPGLIDFGRWMPSWWPEIAWPWYVLIGCSTTILLSLFLSAVRNILPQGQEFSADCKK
jgi:SSS family transporter